MSETKDILKKGKAAPVGAVRKRGSFWYRKLGDGSWKYIGKNKPGNSSEQSTSESSETTVSTSTETSSQDFDLNDKVKEIMAEPNLSGKERVNQMIEAGVRDTKAMELLTKEPISSIIAKLIKTGKSHQDQPIDVESLKSVIPKVPVKERWDAYRLYLDMVADENSGVRSLIAYGTGGVGKTYTMKKVVEGTHNMKEYNAEEHSVGSPDYDYVKITGKNTPTAMYKALYQHNGKLIVFDDCDSVLEQDDSINILKGALDTTGDGTVEYGSGKSIKDKDGNPLPQRFSFKGRAIFISNLTSQQMPQPLRSRALCTDLTMTAQETIDVMRDIVQVMPFYSADGTEKYVSSENRTDAINFIDKYKDAIDIGDLNARTLGQVALIIDKVKKTGVENWESKVLPMFS